MENKDYTFFRTFYDKEILRQALLVLNQESVGFKLKDKSSRGHFRAPLSTYIEVDIMVSSADYEKAEKLLGNHSPE